MILNFELIRVAIALIFTGAAAWQDWKTSFIDDKIVFPMIALGLILDLATLDQNFILFSVGGAALIGAVGFYAYRTGQLGGGDVLLFAGLQLLLPFAPLETASAIGWLPQSEGFLQAAGAVPFILVIFAVASLFALVGSSALYAYRLGQSGKLKIKGKELAIIAVAGLTMGAIYFLNAISPLNLPVLILLLIVFTSSGFTIVYKKEVMDSLVKKLKISEIEDEDILALEKINAKLVTRYGIEKVATKQNLEKLKKMEKREGLHYFPVYKDLPRLGPYIFLALLAGVVLANPVAYFIFS